MRQTYYLDYLASVLFTLLIISSSPSLGQSQETCLGYIAKAESSHKQTQLETVSAKSQLRQTQQRQKQIQTLVAEGAGSKSDLAKIDQQLKQKQNELNKAIAIEKKAKEQLRSLRMMSSCAV